MQQGVVERFMEGDQETRERILMMYGEKLVERLVEAWKAEKENERLCNEYLAENTVSPFRVLVLMVDCVSLLWGCCAEELWM